MTYTPIHNRFWSDGWVRGLNALDRYLFLYLLTNGRAGLTGIYELPLDLMASESGIDQRDLQVMLARLAPKIYYKEGWIIIIKYPNHRVSNSPKLLLGIKNAFNELPTKIRELATSYGYPIHTLSIHIPVSRNRIEENRIDKDSEQSSPIREEREQDLGREKTPRKKTLFTEAMLQRLRVGMGLRTLDGLGGHGQAQKVGEKIRDILVADEMSCAESDVLKAFERLVEAAADNNFHAKNMTNMGYVNRNFEKLIKLL